jgi:hypothetical protein
MGQAFQPRVFDPEASPERIAAWIMQFSPASAAEALKLLRAQFPDHPLSLRVVALGFLARQRAEQLGEA